MPGLTVDRYDTILSVQVLSLGMERVKGCGVQALVEVLREMGQEIRGIYERNDVSIREQEGLTEGKGWYPLPGLPTRNLLVEIVEENGIRYLVDVENGQKAGFSWTRNTTGRRWGASPGANSAGLLYPHRFLRPQCRPGRCGARHQCGHLPVRHRYGCGERPAQRAGGRWTSCARTSLTC